MARADDDGIIGFIVVHRVDVRPVASGTAADDVAEVIVLILLGKFFSRQGLALLGRIDVQAHRTLVNRFEHVVAVRIENFKEPEVVNHIAVAIHLKDHVAHGAHNLVVRALISVGSYAQQIVTVRFNLFRSMRKVGIPGRQTAIKDLATHDVILSVALTVTPAHCAVSFLTEAHHRAAVPNVVKGINGFGQHVPANFARRINDRVLRRIVPLQRAAHRVIPNGLGTACVKLPEVVDEIETILEFRINLLHFRIKETRIAGAVAVCFNISRRCPDSVRLLNVLHLIALPAVILHFHGITPVSIKPKNRNAAIGLSLVVAHFVGDFLSVLFRDDAH